MWWPFKGNILPCTNICTPGMANGLLVPHRARTHESVRNFGENRVGEGGRRTEKGERDKESKKNREIRYRESYDVERNMRRE